VKIGETQAVRGETAERFTSNSRFNKKEQGTGRTVAIGNSWKGSWQARYGAV